MQITITRVSKDDEIRGMLQLQQQNLKKNLTPEAIESQGFVTVEHTFDVLKKMNNAAPSIIAKDGDTVAAYAIVMLPEFAADVPILAGLFAMINQTQYQGRLLNTYPYVVVGQLCVGANYRGLQLVDRMYAHYREALQPDFDLCLTDVSGKNQRSKRVHERVGFEVITSFYDEYAQETWDLIVWDWRNADIRVENRE